ncbi:MAG: iron chelate uptake ABC transporter family permease subunit [Candidatus Methanoplasma sp.]|nr:iron chelate uptake ABC transporter family permease subunit [Candidatus Methanoplasma sp.]
MRRHACILLAILILASSALAIAPPAAGAAPDAPMVLIDMGDGRTYWTEADPDQATMAGVIEGALDDLGLAHGPLGESMAVDGRGPAKVSGSRTVESVWNVYAWDGSSWSKTSRSDYPGGSVALGFYPRYMAPTETPDHPDSWVMARGDAAQRAAQAAAPADGLPETVFEKSYGEKNFVCGVVLAAGGRVFAVAGGGNNSGDPLPTLYAYDAATMEELWRFEYPRGAGYETATGAIAGGYYFLPATCGKLYRIPLSGPGPGNSLVESIDIPMEVEEGRELVGRTYATGPSSITYDMGVLYFESSTGHVYAVDPGLNPAGPGMAVIWRGELLGGTYYMDVTVRDGLLYAGALDGRLYVFDALSGALLASETVFTVTDNRGNVTGSVHVPLVAGGKIFVPFSDGRGMGTVQGGIAIYEFERAGSGGTLTRTAYVMEAGLCGNFALPSETSDFTGIYFTSVKIPLGKMYADGSFEVLNGDLESAKAGMVLLNGEHIAHAEYRSGGYVSILSLDGKVLSRFKQPASVESYCMSAPVFIGGRAYVGTDGGFYSSTWSAYSEGAAPSGGGGVPAAYALAAAAALVAAALALLSRMGYSPLGRARAALGRIAGSEEESRVRRNKRRLLLVLIAGAAAAFFMLLLCLSIGQYGTVSLGDALSAMVSSMQKHGAGLTDVESAIYDSRLPRAVAAIGAGMGLAVAGAVYQAVIRNPLVDPYIMGVSSGAGTFAVASIASGFTFFGLAEGLYATPILAAAGGVAAFLLTMVLAEKAGGSSTNFVLAGVVVGLAFSSVMTIMLITSNPDKLHGALSWLYGSFANVGWDTAWMVLFPAMFMSMIPLVWAKELNLVLLGEDQAMQMGLNVRRFNRLMLILASVLTAVCVSFVGIIGFVGLVVPHVCRMVLGGDHRLVLPASIVVGAALMLFSDLVARTALMPQELPVGAITTMIGVPLFAYLLVRRGRMYDG